MRIMESGSLVSSARLPADPTFTRATVCSGSVETEYRRAGRGDTIVALAARDWGGGRALFPTLARDFRLIVPVLDHTSAGAGARPAFAVWLTTFLDGLGLTSVTLLADERFGGAALGSAMMEPVRVARLVVVLSAAAPEPLATADATLCGTGTKLLVSWLGADVDAAAGELAAMLLGGRRAPG
jgi:hypothetical protein